MMANVIQRAFDTQPCLMARGELLEGFQVRFTPPLHMSNFER